VDNLFLSTNQIARILCPLDSQPYCLNFLKANTIRGSSHITIFYYFNINLTSGIEEGVFYITQAFGWLDPNTWKLPFANQVLASCILSLATRKTETTERPRIRKSPPRKAGPPPKTPESHDDSHRVTTTIISFHPTVLTPVLTTVLYSAHTLASL
jgi:hypothetical protein